MDNLANFKSMLDADGNEDMKARAQKAAAHVIGLAAQQGISMSVEEAYALPSVRLMTLLDEGAPVGDWFAEAEQAGLESFRSAAEEKALMSAVADSKNTEHAKAVDTLNEELSKLTPAEKMRRARELGMRLPGPGEKGRAPMTPEEKAAALVELERLPIAMKLARYREVFG